VDSLREVLAQVASMTTKKASPSSIRPTSAQKPADAPSVAALAAAILDGRHTRRLPKEVVVRLKRYSPKIPDRDWAAIREFVLDAAAATAERTSLDLDRAVVIAAPFVQWAVNVQGLPQEASAVFTRRVIDGYCQHRSDVAVGSVASYRSILLKLADHVAPSENPAPMQPIARRNIKDPYTRAEVEGFRAWAYGQHTASLTQKAKLLLAGSAGAGLWPAELGALQAEDVTATASGVTIWVRARKPREVTLLAEWEEMFLEAIAGSEPGKPVWGPERTAPKNKNLVTDFTEHCDGTPPTSSRLRGSWLARLLDERVHITVIFAASGFKQFNNLHHYLRYLTTPSTQDARGQLRGSGRA
jgi:hypothetical protein